MAKFEVEPEQSLLSVSGEIATRRKRMETLETELGRLAEATRGDAQFYTAEGEWNFVGKNEGRSPVTALTNLEMVAGVRFELTTFGL